MSSQPPRPKLNARLAAAGEHPAKASSVELELQAVSIVNGYRAPKLLLDESGSARAELMAVGKDGETPAQFLRSALSKLETLEMKRRFRHDAASSPVTPVASTAAASTTFRPNIVLGAATDKGERFFRNLQQPRVPLEECFEIPKLGLGLFIQGLVKFMVPPPRAVWAIRAAYPSVVSADLLREMFEKGESANRLIRGSKSFDFFFFFGSCQCKEWS